MEKPERKRLLGRPSCRKENNIKMNLQEVGCEDMDWIEQTQTRDRWWALVNVLTNLRIPCNAGNFLTRWETVHFSRSTLLYAVWSSRSVAFKWEKQNLMK